MQISIKYFYPKRGGLEIQFYRGATLLHNVFCDELSAVDTIPQKQKAAEEFSTMFPEIPQKAIWKAFADFDPTMQKKYNEIFNPRGAGRKTGVKIGRIKEPTIVFARRVTQTEYDCLSAYLQSLRVKN